MRFITRLIIFLFIANFSFGQSDWKYIAPQPFQHPVIKMLFIGDNTLIGIASFNTVYRSTNNGLNWSSQKVNFSDIYNVANVYFLDYNTGWIISGIGRIYKTTDAGVNWFPQESYTNFALKDIKFLNQHTGYIVGNGGTVLKTTDGGNNWYFRGIKQISHQFNSIEILNSDTVIVSGVTGPGPTTQIMVKTLNSGTNWSEISTGQRLYTKLLQTENSNLISLGKDGVYFPELKTSIYLSSNKGLNWNKVFLDSTIEGISLSKRNNEIWLLGNKVISYTESKMIIYKSTNNGYNWNFVSQSNFPVYYSDNHPINFEDNGSMSLYWRFSIYKSQDNGLNWIFNSKDELSSTYEIKFLNHNIGFSKLYDKILRTSNGGVKWDTVNIAKQKLGKFEFIDNTVFFTRWDSVNNLYKSVNSGADFFQINIDNVIPHHINYSAGKLRITFNERVNNTDRFGILTSTDMGMSFSKNYIDNQIQGNIINFKFFGNIGYIFTNYKVYKSIDNGLNWNGIFSLRDLGIFKSGFLDHNFIWFVDYNKKFHKSSNSGVDWDSSVSFSEFSINQNNYDIAVTSPTNYYISALANSQNYFYILYSTTNGGQSWNSETFDTYRSSSISPSLSMFNDNSGFMVFSSIILGKNILTNSNTEVNLNNSFDFKLYQNYPNPFNPNSKIKFEINKGSKVSLKIYDITGKYISTLVEDFFDNGIYEAEFNGINLSSGVYFYVLSSNQYTVSKKMLLLK